jgi:UDP-N-acetylglucosamine 2-epimerase (non-hydrolysing)
MGTRPEIIKLVPVIHALHKAPRVSVSVILTGQHRELAEQALKAFRVPIDRDLGLMKAGQSPAEVAAGTLQGLERAWRVRPPSAALVQGDTTSAMVVGLTAFYKRIPVGHVEAGLRTGDLGAPYPEDLNRKLIAAFARWNFAPPKRAMLNLLREGVSPGRVYVTGNTIVDALHLARRRIASMSPSALGSLRKEIAPEGGSARLVGTDSEALVRHTIRLVRDNVLYARMTRSSRLFGDSRSGMRIARILVRSLEEAE